jgi:hypothetical protein
VAAGNHSAKFFQGNAEIAGLRIWHAVHKIKEDISIAPSIADDMAFGKGHRVAAGARNDEVQILYQKRNLLLSQ